MRFLRGLKLAITVFAGGILVNIPFAMSQETFEARALVQAVEQAKLSSAIAAQITALPVREGEKFSKGSRLIGFDCTLHKARLRVVRAQLDGDEKTLKNKKHLLKLQSAGELEVELAQAAVERAKGEMEGAQYAVDQCDIVAPFDGKVISKGVNLYEMVAPGDGLLTILADGSLEVALVIPSRWLSWLRVGTTFSLRVDETGKIVEGEISRLGAVIDPVSQSISVFGRIMSQEDQETLIAGMSGTARFPEPSLQSQ